MERNRWETAIRCLEVAVHPNTRDDEIVAAVNGFRRTAEGVPLGQVCIEFACGGVPLAELAAMTENLDRLRRENLELRRKLIVYEAAQGEAAGRLDVAHRRIYELTEEAAAARLLTETIARDFEDFRGAYARAIDAILHDNANAHTALDETKCAATPPGRPFSAFLAEARLGEDKAASFAGIGNGSGRVPPGDFGGPPSWSA
jgi:hypothetical protein